MMCKDCGKEAKLLTQCDCENIMYTWRCKKCEKVNALHDNCIFCEGEEKMLRTPEQLEQDFTKTLLQYTELHTHWETSKKEPCACSKVAFGKCRRCERIRSLETQMYSVISLVGKL